jgi:hypothetical protein
LAASTAAAEVSNLLDQFTSDKVGTVSIMSPVLEQPQDEDGTVFYGSPEPVKWLRRSTDTMDSHAMVVEEQGIPYCPLRTPPKRSKTFHRADTPIMSNSSARKLKPKISSMPTMTTPAAEEEDQEVPFNVESPWVTTMQRVTTPGTTTTQQRMTTMTPSVNSMHADVCRYHDVLCLSVHAKRNLVDQMDLLN